MLFSLMKKKFGLIALRTRHTDDVLDLAEELIAWMSDNPESMGTPDESDGSDETDESGEESTDGSGSGSGDENGENEDGSDDRDDAGSSTATPVLMMQESGEDKGLDTLGDKSDVIEGGTDGEGVTTPNIAKDEKFGKSLRNFVILVHFL